MDQVKWTHEKSLELIHRYHTKTVLWSPKNLKYYDKRQKARAWQEIGRVMGTSAHFCKYKMINLLASFRREKMKMKIRLEKGYPKFHSPWFAFKAMSFLLDKSKTQNIDNADNQHIKLEEEVFVNEEDEIVEDTIEIEREVENNEKENLWTANEICGTSLEIDSTENAEMQLLQGAMAIIKSANSTTENEEIASFLAFIGKKMMRYSEKTKNCVQHAISDIIFKADQHHFE